MKMRTCQLHDIAILAIYTLQFSSSVVDVLRC